MTSFDDTVSTALKALHNFGNTVMLHLSGRQDQKENIEKAGEAWELLKKDLGQAMANDRNAMSIKQTKYHRGGVSWVDTTLVNFMSALNTVIYDPTFQDEEVRQMVRKDGVKSASMIQEVLMDEQMLKRPLAMSMGLVQEVDEGASRDNGKAAQYLSCPYGCAARFGTVKTLKAHMQKFHPSSKAPKSQQSAKRPQDTRITCAMCAGKTTYLLHRMKEHLQKVHHRGPYAKNLKFMGFEMSSPGHYEPRFAYASGRSGSLVPREQVTTFANTVESAGNKSDESPLASDVEPGYTVESAGDKSDVSPLISDVEPFPVTAGTSTPTDEIYEPEEKLPEQQTGARRKLKMGVVGKGKKARKVEEISDYEEGDTDLWTEGRRRAKNSRYARRTEVEKQVIPLHEMEANKMFIEDFDSSRVHSGKATIHKYTRYLFIAADSWLVHKTGLMEGDFELSRLVDWTGRLMQPGEIDGWLNTVPDEPINGSKRYAKA